MRMAVREPRSGSWAGSIRFASEEMVREPVRAAGSGAGEAVGEGGQRVGADPEHHVEGLGGLGHAGDGGGQPGRLVGRAGTTPDVSGWVGAESR